MSPREARAVLGVPSSATYAQARAAYNRCVVHAHPDRGGTREAFEQVRRAMEILREEREGASEAVEEAQGDAEAVAKARAYFKSRCFSAAAASFGQAAEAFRMANDGKQQAAMHANESAAHLADGDADAALGAADECVRARPKWHKGHFRRAEAFEAMGELPRAKRSYAEALGLADVPGADAADVALLHERIEGVDGRIAKGEGARRLPRTSAGDAPPAFAKTNDSNAAIAEAPEDDDGDIPEAIARIADGLERLRIAQHHAEASGDHQKVKELTEAIQLQESMLKIERDHFEAVQRFGGDDNNAAPFYKRCRFCGNVQHGLVKLCTSCCLPIASVESFDVVEQMPGMHDGGRDNASFLTNPLPAHDSRGPQRGAHGPVAGPSPVAEVPTAAATQLPAAGPLTQEASGAATTPTTADEDASLDHARLGVRADAPLSVCRDAYRKRVVEAHPALGGTEDELAEVRASFERIAESSMARIRAAAPDPTPTDQPRIFLAMACYRDPEGIRSLASAFNAASNPHRVFAGVCWQYANAAEPKGEVTRAYLRVNRLTAKIEEEARQMGESNKEDSGQEAFLRKCLKHQRKLQTEEQRREAECHTTAHPCFPAEFRSHVQEVHEHYTHADGAPYARWKAHALWRGEEFTLQVDSHTRFVEGWDDLLLAQYDACPHEKCVLTNNLLMYERAPKLTEMAEEDRSTTDVAVLPPPSARTPLATCAHFWDPQSLSDRCLPYTMARPLADEHLARLDGSPFPAFFLVTHFVFAPSAAFQRDVRADLHMAYLTSNAEALATAARFVSHGYTLMHCGKCPGFTLYTNHYRPIYDAEDARRGDRLYADKTEALGTEPEFQLRSALFRLSLRRALQQCGLPCPGVAPGEGAERLGRYGPGPACDPEEFVDRIGLDVTSGQLKGKARLGGLAPEAFAQARSPYLPSHWRTGGVLDRLYGT